MAVVAAEWWYLCGDCRLATSVHAGVGGWKGWHQTKREKKKKKEEKKRRKEEEKMKKKEEKKRRKKEKHVSTHMNISIRAQKDEHE